MNHKNTLSKELMHKEDTPDKVARRVVANQMYDELKSQANKKWYQKNKDWKKKYNADYYRNHRDYWRERYKTDLVLGNHRFPSTYEMEDASIEKELNKNTRKQIQKDAEARIRGGLWSTSSAQSYAQQQLMDLKVDEAMYKYNQQAYQHYMDNHRKMPVKEAWSDGAKQIRDAGKKFIQKFKDIPGLRKKSKS
jgi:hypothetical protein